MCCFKRPRRIHRKYRRKSVIYPEPEDVIARRRRNAVDSEFIDKFVKEVIYCGGCKQPFNLGSNELKIHCNLCNQFFHCKIAGECSGDDCKIIKENGEIHRSSYCYDCMGLVTQTKKLCKDCFMDDHLSKN